MWSGLKRLSRRPLLTVMAFNSADGLVTATADLAAMQAKQFFLDLHRYPTSATSLVAHLQRETWRVHLSVIEPAKTKIKSQKEKSSLPYNEAEIKKHQDRISYTTGY